MNTSRGQELWKKAKGLIPGGTQLLSKRPERFLPGLWPTYYQKAQGCEVWDLDGNHFYDFAQMGVGSCILGYADPDVNQAVLRAVENGSMSSLNCPEEIELAEKVATLLPGKNMVRFTRGGGEAVSVAIRIARAHAGKGTVVLCGYHGWHDWYLAANLENDASLDGQLLPGLKPKGLPRQLKGTTLTFNYNRLDEFEALVSQYGSEIGVICMEPVRNQPPDPGFFEAIRKIADRIGAVLIFDEITSGFRVNAGGAHKLYGVDPDMAVFGKALGNGFPIAAVVGKSEIMQSAQDTFISSTFWTERVGFAAGLATIKKFEAQKVHEKLIYYGEKIGGIWKHLGEKYDLRLLVYGIAPLSSLSFKEEKPLVYQTIYAQEMLERGFLMGAAVYTTYAYSDSILEKFKAASEEAFATLQKAKTSGNPESFLRGPVMEPGFKRLN